jgi:hypothetical protein
MAILLSTTTTSSSRIVRHHRIMVAGILHVVLTLRHRQPLWSAIRLIRTIVKKEHRSIRLRVEVNSTIVVDSRCRPVIIHITKNSNSSHRRNGSIRVVSISNSSGHHHRRNGNILVAIRSRSCVHHHQDLDPMAAVLLFRIITPALRRCPTNNSNIPPAINSTRVRRRSHLNNTITKDTLPDIHMDHFLYHSPTTSSHFP